ncbi:Uncharacterised protein [Lacrimispora sphenoides]|uniref:Uncharacterized protein n=1 Tax=Lacrimispora sphenoides JCM 1415 TaxID=1297793 RepID=A0ABY1C5S2_9FIRM|nr:hypothetical protein SAMN02745906_1313 [[Clostridium] sphenoides JCM 1415]SUY50682.1 Uncharacterised protein [Lacrimispora sphenoides]
MHACSFDVCRNNRMELAQRVASGFEVYAEWRNV